MKFFSTLFTLVFVVLSACSQQKQIQKPIDYTANQFSQNGYTLHFESNDPNFSMLTKQRLIETFFKVYPQLAAEYNSSTSKTVYFVIDTAYKGVAATGHSRTVFNPVWFVKNPEDIDVVTHEVMHIVQSYKSYRPAWLVEGIADYARYKFGVNNEKAGWSMPMVNDQQSYTNSYRITARFLAWIENKVKKGTVQKLDDALRDDNYTSVLWKDITGKTLDELWDAYRISPML